MAWLKIPAQSLLSETTTPWHGTECPPSIPGRSSHATAWHRCRAQPAQAERPCHSLARQARRNGAEPYNGAMSEPVDDFEYERRFFCRGIPSELGDADVPTLIVQSYYVHADNYALRVRLQSRSVRVPMTPGTDPMALLDRYGDRFTEAFVTVKGPSVGGTRYEAEREIDSRIAVELVRRGGSVIVKNRYSVWIAEDGWNIDVFGGVNAPLVVAEAERSGPVTNLTIPRFCVTEITDEARFSNDGLAARPFGGWAADFERELAGNGPHFQPYFGRNVMQ